MSRKVGVYGNGELVTFQYKGNERVFHRIYHQCSSSPWWPFAFHPLFVAWSWISPNGSQGCSCSTPWQAVWSSWSEAHGRPARRDLSQRKFSQESPLEGKDWQICFIILTFIFSDYDFWVEGLSSQPYLLKALSQLDWLLAVLYVVNLLKGVILPTFKAIYIINVKLIRRRK